MALTGPNTVGYIGLGGYSILANKNAFSYKPVGVTIDWSTITAEASARTLPGGFVTTIGDKVIPAGSVLYKLGNGKYGVATSATTLVKGATFLAERHIVQSIDSEQIGTVLDNGNVIESRIAQGASSRSTLLANLYAACPALRPLTD